MCGIFGCFGSGHALSPEIKAWGVSTQKTLAHRGPDGTELKDFAGSNCLLGHRRLSIIDLEGGTQPLSNEDGTIWIALNGEIYNYVELRRDLESRHQFRTHSDTEVLVHLYEEKGESMLDDLVGMFAFAIFDRRKESLFLARDRFGEKPLYYAHTTEGLAFASELKALLDFPGVQLTPDVPAIAQYLALGFIPAPRTHISSIRKLRAAESLTFSTGSEPKLRRYWKLNFTGDDLRPLNMLVDEFRQRMRDSVRLRLRSDVPLGAFLSGGIDSTLVVATMRDLLPNAELRTYCAGFDNPVLDERPYARSAANLFQTRHCEIDVREDDLVHHLWDLVMHYDEPYADYSLLPTYAVCKAASADVKVVLSGDGADELFGGYGSYYNYSNWHVVRRTPGVSALASSLSRFWTKGKSGSGLLAFLSKNDTALLRSSVNAQVALSLLRPGIHEAANEGVNEIYLTLADHASRPYPNSLMEAQATELTLPDQLMVKVDRASMRVGLETRAPFLDHRLAEFAARIPAHINFHARMGKILLREALPLSVPNEIRWRAKRGFTPPLAEWLRNSLHAECRASIESPPAQLQQFADPRALLPLIEAHANRTHDYHDILFRWMVLAKHFDAARAMRTASA